MSETDPDIDVICKELVEWMDGWELYSSFTDDGVGWKKESSDVPIARPFDMIKQSLDLVREIEEAVGNQLGKVEYYSNVAVLLDFPSEGGLRTEQEAELLYLKPKTLLIALHRTLREAEEI